MLCSHVLRVMEILHLVEIPAKHVLKRWTKDARDILPGHLVQYQRDNSINTSFTYRHSTLYFKAMEVVRMGDASACAYEFMIAGMDDLLVRCAPIAEQRDALGFEDHGQPLLLGTQPCNGEAEMFVSDRVPRENSAAHSGNANALEGLSAPQKTCGVGRPTNSRENAPYETLSKCTRFCSICRREGHMPTTCPDRGDAPKKPRKPGRCKNCGIEGHRRNNCTRAIDASGN